MKLNKLSHKKDFDMIYKNYLLPLMGMSFESPYLKVRINNNKKILDTEFKDNELFMYFYENEYGNRCYSVKVLSSFPNRTNVIKLITKVYEELNRIRFRKFDGSINIDYQNEYHLHQNYEYAVQKGIVEWISGQIPSDLILKLLEKLEIWRQKTYEGKHVPFAFVIDPKITSNTQFNYLHFLEEEFSATFSDGITSIIELDKNLNFNKYLSITNPNNNATKSIDNTPYRFSDIIESFTKQKLGVFLLSSGDILLVKNAKIELVKREGKWLNFNRNVFTEIIISEFEKFSNNTKFKKLINEIYLSAIDVSFAHAGGIIACITDEESIEKLTNTSIFSNIFENKTIIDDKTAKTLIHYMDNLQLKLPDYEELKKISNPNTFNSSETKKRMIKRNFIEIVTNKKSFVALDRKLRCELISMDGATILDMNGNIISIGAIIQNESGSYGGGRSAAARTLAKYGFAIKISTDGYIEVYKQIPNFESKLAYRIK